MPAKPFHRRPTEALTTLWQYTALRPTYVFLGLCSILVTLAKMNWYLPQSYDIWLWDETWYLHNGISDPQEFFYFGSSYENGPLYSFFYAVIHSLVWRDPIYTYLYGGAVVIVFCLVMA